MIEFTPEQREEINKMIATAKFEAQEFYDKRAHKFRETIKAHPVPMANLIGWVALFIGMGIGWYANSFFSMFGN